MSWAPDTNTPFQAYESSTLKGLKQWFKWTSLQLQELHNVRQGVNYQHEVKRFHPGTINKYNCWDFLYSCGFMGWSCCCSYTTNLPNPNPWYSEESDIYLSCGWIPFINDDEEAEMIAGGTANLQANTWYYVTYYFRRKSGEKGNPVRTIWEHELPIYPSFLRDETADIEFTA